jgi:hypothetical protein
VKENPTLRQVKRRGDYSGHDLRERLGARKGRDFWKRSAGLLEAPLEAAGQSTFRTDAAKR